MVRRIRTETQIPKLDALPSRVGFTRDSMNRWYFDRKPYMLVKKEKRKVFYRKISKVRTIRQAAKVVKELNSPYYTTMELIKREIQFPCKDGKYRGYREVSDKPTENHYMDKNGVIHYKPQRWSHRRKPNKSLPIQEKWRLYRENKKKGRVRKRTTELRAQQMQRSINRWDSNVQIKGKGYTKEQREMWLLENLSYKQLLTLGKRPIESDHSRDCYGRSTYYWWNTKTTAFGRKLEDGEG